MSSNKDIKVAIADDHQMVVDGLMHMLDGYPHIQVQHTYLNGQGLLAGLQREQPDVLLLDIHLTDYVGEDLVPLIVKNYPAVRILAVTSVDNIARVRNLVRQGCLGYVLKNVQSGILVQAIETVYKGTSFITEDLKEQLLQELLHLKKELPAQPLLLTRREKEILQLIAREYSSKEIADQLFISLNTVEIHRKHLFQKMDVKNVAGLIRKALQLGLIS